jgi:hypothetical protein
MAFNLDKGKENAKSIRDILNDINRLTEENLKLEKQKLATEQRINAEQQDISNTIKDQTKQLKFQKAEKSAILRATNSISRISENISTFQKQELVDAKAITKLGKDRVKINKDISLLKQTQKKLITETAGLSSDQVKANFALAGSMDDQIKNAIILKAEIAAVEKSSQRIFDTDGVKNAKFVGQILDKVPALSAFKGVFDGAAKEAADAVSEMESTNFGLDKYEELRKAEMSHEDAMEAAGVSQAEIDKGRFSIQQMNSKSIMVSMQSMLKSLKAALSPAAMLAAFLNAFISSDKAAGDMAKKLNVSYKDALAMRKELRTSADASNENFVTTKGMQESLVAINQSLGTGVMLNNQMLSEFTEMREMAGFTNEELQGIAAISLTTGKSMNDVTGEFMAQAKISAQQNGVLLNEKDLLKDIGNISAATTLSFSKNPKLIGEAVATAKALGMELSKVEGIADSMLDFESSITNELEAELLLNKDINLEKARQAALNNDLATVAKEISDQVGSSADFAAMNRIQQEALAKSVGMNRDSLAETLFIQEQLAGATGEEAAEQEALLNARIKEVGLAQAQKELAEGGIEGLREQNSQAEKLSQSIAKIQELFVAIAEPVLELTNGLMPILDIVGFVVGGIGKMITGITTFSNMIGEAIGGFGRLAEGLGPLNVLLKGIAGIAIVLAAYGAYAALAWIPVVGPLLGIAAAAAVTTAGFSALSGAEKAGDMFSANGKTMVSPAEGGLFELSDNDEFAAAPGLGQMLGGGNNTTVVENKTDMSSTNALLEKLVKKTPEMAPLGLYEVQ